uniref:Uncharacterized protein n=1 Tax=Chromera velia CCMP2878 TaxID=1169474 RepID=A0A0G4ICA6_9ALVE|eukprot:Cvel_2254.t1-p1 / transcript=Cvel_2254.t1 / gene=Cvel_2254 / organism=Chromera_velia_CCMP2878 / gene_product=hypothetical protein / transcript_product=hypothetical protein / location=Cvel_scaffold87:35608-36279(+) / protein_length=224 / sequence_SO=supercontig / SO=protein_coding / is_pseudo=false
MKLTIHRMMQRRLQDNSLPSLQNADISILKAVNDQCEELWGNEIDSERAGGAGWKKIYRPDLVERHQFGMSYVRARLLEWQEEAQNEVCDLVEELESAEGKGVNDLITKYTFFSEVAKIDADLSVEEITQLEEDLKEKRGEDRGSEPVEEGVEAESAAAAERKEGRTGRGRRDHLRDVRLSSANNTLHRKKTGGRVVNKCPSQCPELAKLVETLTIEGKDEHII